MDVDDAGLAGHEREMSVEAVYALARHLEAQMRYDDAKAELDEAYEAVAALRAFGVIRA